MVGDHSPLTFLREYQLIRDQPVASGFAFFAYSTAEKATGLLQRLVDELAMQRRISSRAHVAADPAFVLDLSIFLMIDREAGYSSERSGSSLIAAAPSGPVLRFRTPDAAATIVRVQAAAALDLDREGLRRPSGSKPSVRSVMRHGRLGSAIPSRGQSKACLQVRGDRNCAFHDHLGQLLGIDVARWWRPTGANYFDRVPKALALEALTDVGGPALAARYAKAKKAQLAETCERVFAGEFLGEVEVKQAALAWVPDAMRFGASSLAEAGEVGGCDLDVPPWEEASPQGAEAASVPPGGASDIEAAEERGGSESGERIDEAA